MTGRGTALPCGQSGGDARLAGMRVWQQWIEVAARNGDNL